LWLGVGRGGGLKRGVLGGGWVSGLWGGVGLRPVGPQGGGGVGGGGVCVGAMPTWGLGGEGGRRLGNPVKGGEDRWGAVR